MCHRLLSLVVFLISMSGSSSLFAASFAEFFDNFTDNNIPAQEGRIAYLEVTAYEPKYDLDGRSTVPVLFNQVVGGVDINLPEGFVFEVFAEISSERIIRDPSGKNKAYVVVQLGKPSMDRSRTDVNFELTIRTQSYRATETGIISGGVILDVMTGPFYKNQEVSSENADDIKFQVHRKKLVTAKTLEENGLLTKSVKQNQKKLYASPAGMKCLAIFN